MKILEEIRVDYPNMPFKLYNKIYNYIESRNIAEKKLDTNELTNSLPYNLRNALLLVMYNSCIRNFKLFKRCDNSNFIIQILSSFIPSISKKSEILVYEGEMIEEIVIVKDGRLSLEAAIDIEDPETSIRKYFNVNFEGISTEKEMKRIKSHKKETTSDIFQSKNIKDFDRAKNVLSTVVKKQANYLLNEACEDNSILDKTKNDIKKEKPVAKSIAGDFLKNEPIRNDQGNYKYIKIIDIRKNENFGGLYMFMRRPSPLSLKVKSKFAELYLIPKKDIFDIAKNNNNIWNKINKKDFHNMLSIKHKTFNILNKYIETNGIGRITPNDVSRFVYAWEDRKKKNIKNNNNISDLSNIINNNNNDKNKLFFLDNNSILLCSSPSHIQNQNNNQIFRNNNIKHLNKQKMHNFFSTKTIDNIEKNSKKSNQPINNEMDFSKLLAVVADGKQNELNTNSNYNTNYLNSINNNENSNNVNTNTNKENEKRQSTHSFVSNFFNNKQKTNDDNIEEGNTMILPNESQENLPATLSYVFNEKKAEEIKEEMKNSKKKENRRKIFNFGKKVSKIIKNYDVILLEKNKEESMIIGNKNINSPKSNNKDNLNYTKNILSYNKDKEILDNVPEIESDEEYSMHQFPQSDLSQEGAITFSIEREYQNINEHTKFEYSKNKKYQLKTLNFLTKIMKNKIENSVSLSDSEISSKKSSSFSHPFSNSSDSISIHFDNEKKKEKNKFFRNTAKEQKTNDILELPESSEENNINQSEVLHKKKKVRNKNNQKISIESSEFSKFTEQKKNTNIGYNSEYKPRKSNKKNSIKIKLTKRSKKISKNLKNNDNNEKYSLKNDSDNDINDINKEIISKNNTKKKIAKKRISLTLNKKEKSENGKSDSFISSEINDKKIKNSKTTKNLKKRNQLNLNAKITNQHNKKRKTLNLDIINDINKGGIQNSMAYFAKEEKDGCEII